MSPELQQRLMERLASPSATEHHYAGILLEHLLQLPHTEVVVEVNGVWTRFGAVAVEFAHRPDTGHYGALSRNRRLLYAWSIEDHREQFLLGGGAFPGPMGWPFPKFESDLESEPEEYRGYRPHVFLSEHDGRKWLNRRGTASFATVGLRRVDCAISPVWSTAFRTIRDDGSVDSSSTGNFTCEEVSYEVSFETELGWIEVLWRDAAKRGRLTLRMPPQEVPGIRMTRDCDGTPGAQWHGCGFWLYAPAELCVAPELNPDPAPYCAQRNKGVPADTGGHHGAHRDRR